MCIRRAKLEDAAEIGSVILCAGETGKEDFDDAGWNGFVNLTGLESVRKRLQKQEYLTLCYSKNDNIVGVIAIRDLRKIDQLFVLPGMRRQGVANKLWIMAKEICLRDGNSGEFNVKSSSHAIPVYEKFGFRIIGDKVVQDGVSCTPMRLVL